MDKETLIKVVAMLDATVVEKVGIIWDNEWEDGYNQGYVDALKHLAITLESAIDADVASMETSMGM